MLFDVEVPEGVELDWITVYLAVDEATYDEILEKLMAAGAKVDNRFDSRTGERIRGDVRWAGENGVDYLLRCREPLQGLGRKLAAEERREVGPAVAPSPPEDGDPDGGPPEAGPNVGGLPSGAPEQPGLRVVQ